MKADDTRFAEASVVSENEVSGANRGTTHALRRMTNERMYVRTCVTTELGKREEK